MIRTIVSDGCVIMFAPFLVLHPLPGDKLTAKILDKNGVEVPHTDYVLDIDGERVRAIAHSMCRHGVYRHSAAEVTNLGNSRQRSAPSAPPTRA